MAVDKTDIEPRNRDEHSAAPPTWRQSCVFSVMALVMLAALVSCEWPLVNHTGARIESVLRAAVWIYISGLCVMSVLLAVKGFKAHRDRSNRIQSRLCVFAIAIDVVAALIVYLVFIRVWIL